MNATFAPGDRVIYTRMERPANTEWPATYVRAQEISGRMMHVVILDEKLGHPHPRQVGWDSIRAAGPPA